MGRRKGVISSDGGTKEKNRASMLKLHDMYLYENVMMKPLA